MIRVTPLEILAALMLGACVPTDATPPPGSDGSPQQPRPEAPRGPGRLNDPRATVGQPMAVRPSGSVASPVGIGLPTAPITATERLPGQSASARPPASARPGETLPKTGAGPAPSAAADVTGKAALIKEPYSDFFQRTELGPDWSATSGAWRIEGGRLCGRGARNHPIWLRRRLPVNARIEFEASSASPEGDLKVELWGDGKSFAKSTSYSDATSYLAILGGWKNQFHVLARIDEHAKNRPEIKIDPSGNDLKARPVVANQTYHFKIERTDGKTLRWLVDDIELFTFSDPNPLKGEGHEHLGFNDWEVPVCFDNLKIAPIAGG